MWHKALKTVLVVSSGLQLAMAVGCASMVRQPGTDAPPCVPCTIPRELDKVSLPDYIIEPPDIIAINTVNLLVPKPPYQLRPLDVITVTVRGTPQDIPIDGSFPIETNGTILLGFDYGSVAVAGKTEDEAREAILKHMRGILKEEPEVLVKISETASEQQIAGQHLVQLDGKVNLGSHGRVRIVGMTIEEAKETIEAHLAQFFLDPEIALDIFAFNSKSYYIITQGAGLGDRVVSLPIMGNETVLDAIAQIGGLTGESSYRIWIARPGGNQAGGDQLMPVDMLAITQRADPTTNYQIFPGDRLYIAEHPLLAIDNELAKYFAPAERVVGFFYLLNRVGQNRGGGGGGGGF